LAPDAARIEFVNCLNGMLLDLRVAPNDQYITGIGRYWLAEEWPLCCEGWKRLKAERVIHTHYELCSHLVIWSPLDLQYEGGASG
jgi:hypothetical protein